jgi:calcineurin-like phosphoesterase family protein
MLIKFDDIPTNIWFTSDQHFGHANIIKFCNRLFDGVNMMDVGLVKSWNNVIGKEDTVYHLGDFTLGDGYIADWYFDMLNGNINVLVNSWHHDKRWQRWLGSEIMDEYHTGVDKAIKLLPPMVVLEIPQPNSDYPLAITLCHYPLAEWDRKHYGGICLHGHSHGNYKPPNVGDLILDVGVDSAAKLLGEYRPFSFQEVFECLEMKVEANQ